MYKISLKNVRGISALEFIYPKSPGVYLLTGTNGSGKTTLLVALYRLYHNLAFKDNFKESSAVVDSFKRAQIIYSIDDDTVTYQKRKDRWSPTPKGKANLIKNFPCNDILFLSTSSLRFYVQEPLILKNPTYSDANNNIINSLNAILSTNKFDNLKVVKIKKPKGRQKNLHRKDKLYIVKNGINNYSELNFSLGERLLLNALDYIESIKSESLLLIDEIELALHPIAQIKFYDYLQSIAKEKKLTVIISTHSSSLIKHSNRRLYLENVNGNVTVLENCYPAYILKGIASEEDIVPDYIFFVEDIMAYRYLHNVIKMYQQKKNNHSLIKIIPIGGYKQVVNFMADYSSLPFPKERMQAFLDNDVEKILAEIKKKPNSTDAEKELINLFQNNKSNITYLSITPELGIWTWIKENIETLEKRIRIDYGEQHFSICDIVNQVEKEEINNKKSETPADLRQWAKGCFKNLTEKFSSQINDVNCQELCKLFVELYVENRMDETSFYNHVQEVLGKILHRKNL